MAFIVVELPAVHQDSEDFERLLALALQCGDSSFSAAESREMPAPKLNVTNSYSRLNLSLPTPVYSNYVPESHTAEMSSSTCSQ